MVIAGSGCGIAKVEHQTSFFKGKLPRPGTIYVHKFAATAEEIPGNSRLAREFPPEKGPLSLGQIEVGHRLGREMASQLVSQIRTMGMRAQVATEGSTPRVNDILIRGYLVSVHRGDAGERVVIGFGYGASELHTALEGFQMTPQGLRRLGEGDVEAGSGKTPGGAMGVLTLAATKNPAGLIISTGKKLYDEKHGKNTVENLAKETVEEIAGVLRKKMQEQGWVK
jgi:hypothetical protein